MPEDNPDGDHPSFNSFRTATGFFQLWWVSLQDQNFIIRLMQSKSPFQTWWLVCFQSNIVFLKIYKSQFYSLQTRNIWKRSVQKCRSYGTLNKTTLFFFACVLSDGCGPAVHRGTGRHGPRSLFSETFRNVFLFKWTSHQGSSLVYNHFCLNFRVVFKDQFLCSNLVIILMSSKE